MNQAISPRVERSDLSFTVDDVSAFVFRVPTDPPVQTSFGVMHERPAVLLRVRDRDGAFGWGEVWCNFPSVGAEHRARLAVSCLPPLLLGSRWENPQACFTQLTERLRVLAIQSGEAGPFGQILAALDAAVWDLLARRHQQPLWRLLTGDTGSASPAIPVYASGLNPTAPEALAGAKWDQGYRAFKLKVGFGTQRDTENLRALRQVIGASTPLMVDANQAWSFDEAVAAGQRMADFDLRWMEEPIRADATLAEWQALATRQPLPLAAGENLFGEAQFNAYVAAPGLSVVQPDIGKWGGFSGCMPLGQATRAAGKQFCPHWLGGGIGLMASLHLKAAVGGAGYVEVDANPNPLRDLWAPSTLQLDEGRVRLSDAPGLGVVPNAASCQDFRVQVAGVPHTAL